MAKVNTNTTASETKVPSLEEQLANLPSKSARIRHLSAMGKKRGEIAKILGIRYQHVRNVLITPVKKVS